MKVKKFHQFVQLVKGPKNTCIIDLLKGCVLGADNDLIEAFDKGCYDSISDFIHSLEKEELIIDIDEKKWIPEIEFGNEETEEFPLKLELEEEVDPELIKRKFQNVKISFITLYGGNALPQLLPLGPIQRKKKDMEQCVALTTVNGKFDGIDRDIFIFNNIYNSCWGKKLAITNNGSVKICIYSDIIIGNLEEDNIESIIKKAKRYWKITKDKVERCKGCEFRYVCFDCREIAQRESGNLYSTNSNCSYEPYKGTWAD